MMDIRNGVVYDTSDCTAHGMASLGLSPIEGREQEFVKMMCECSCSTVEVVVRKVAAVRRLRAASRYSECPGASRGVVVLDQTGAARHFKRFPVMYYGDRITEELWAQGRDCVPTLV